MPSCILHGTPNTINKTAGFDKEQLHNGAADESCTAFAIYSEGVPTALRKYYKITNMQHGHAVL